MAGNLNLQSFVEVAKLRANCFSFYLPNRVGSWKLEVKFFCFEKLIPGLPAHKSKHALERLMTEAVTVKR